MAKHLITWLFKADDGGVKSATMEVSSQLLYSVGGQSQLEMGMQMLQERKTMLVDSGGMQAGAAGTGMAGAGKGGATEAPSPVGPKQVRVYICPSSPVDATCDRWAQQGGQLEQGQSVDVRTVLGPMLTLFASPREQQSDG